MTKALRRDLADLISAVVVMLAFGAKDACYQMLKIMNTTIYQLYGASLPNFLFKHVITYFIVGILFTVFNVKRGRAGHYIGKILYFVVGCIIGFILDVVANIIF